MVSIISSISINTTIIVMIATMIMIMLTITLIIIIIITIKYIKRICSGQICILTWLQQMSAYSAGHNFTGSTIIA